MVSPDLRRHLASLKCLPGSPFETASRSRNGRTHPTHGCIQRRKALERAPMARAARRGGELARKSAACVNAMRVLGGGRS